VVLLIKWIVLQSRPLHKDPPAGPEREKVTDPTP